MYFVRNSINISGITPEEELPNEIKGQMIEFSETDYLYIPQNKPPVDNIKKIDINIRTEQGRQINSPISRIIVLDGIRSFNITYTSSNYYKNSYNLSLELPFNTFIDFNNKTEEIVSIDTYIADAYFKAITSRKIYFHILYLVNVKYLNSHEDSS